MSCGPTQTAKKPQPPATPPRLDQKGYDKGNTKSGKPARTSAPYNRQNKPWGGSAQDRSEKSPHPWHGYQKMDEKPSWGKDAWASEWKPFRNRDSSGSLDWWIQ